MQTALVTQKAAQLQFSVKNTETRTMKVKHLIESSLTVNHKLADTGHGKLVWRTTPNQCTDPK